MTFRIGDVGRALSDLSPSGYVEIGGTRHSARSEGMFIAAGSSVVVLRGEPPSFVVREVPAGQPPPRLPNHGELIEKHEHQMTTADVAEVERREGLARWELLKKRMTVGSAAAGAFGVIVGLAAGGLAARYGWAGADTPVELVPLLGWSAAACAAGAVALYFLTGFLAPKLLPYEDRGFAADFLGIVAGLVGGLLGFWLNFGGGLSTAAGWSVGLAAAFAAVGCAASWLLSLAMN